MGQEKFFVGKYFFSPCVRREVVTHMGGVGRGI